MAQSSNTVWHEQTVSKEQRREKNGHHSFTVWLTGLSGSGKSTIANLLSHELFNRETQVYVLDGDNIRQGLNGDLGFSEEDRVENIRRIGEVSKLFVDSGSVVVTAFISPFRDDRKQVRELLQEKEFIEVYVKCPLEECENRDPKGLYKKARSGQIKNFTGLDSPYEEPDQPEYVLETDKKSPEECTAQLLRYLEDSGYIQKKI
ncbi:adenylyl-sulfate kinase [Metabacillus sp. GX 13764]|uniref:adenylyl-sulfate kinase n=1 Tax=Metabacillus kandeliae TaxID=2900151 RepID=UPI001E54F1A5|nr:adenylyl-sulfate kinase [Metabacillus kandeliae]MCD7033850.1 adenylyl-sulfate kinase [Metabacillus kandeliae]